jgi:glutamate-1-semialdehyde 2,1-aminomutase
LPSPRSEARSRELFTVAQKVLVGGVDSPVRSFRGVGRQNPLFISRAKGSKIYDVDGNEYVDFVGSWGASILGSASPRVVREVSAAANRGLSFGAATSQETILAEKIKASMPSIELLRFVCSGTEATMSAIRVARAFTKKDKIVKFDGCYHGHADSFLVRAGSGLATFSISDSAGVPQGTASNTLVASFNDIDSVKRLIEQNPVAAVIIEPVAGNMGVVPPKNGFLQDLRQLCDENGSLLIFDEVITGFRVARGGAQELYQVKPDLTCLGKVIGGGMNIAAYGGRRDVMELVSPLGPVYQAGTLAGNPVAVACGIATLGALHLAFYKRLEAKSKQLEHSLAEKAKDAGVNIRLQRVGSMIGLFFLAAEDSNLPIESYYAVKTRSVKDAYAAFFNSMIAKGIYLPPSAFETIFVSSAHTASDISKTLRAAEISFSNLAKRTPAVA